jgi:hypothetical protein
MMTFAGGTVSNQIIISSKMGRAEARESWSWDETRG